MLLVMLAVIAIVAAMLLPALAKAKQRAQRINCVNNLKQDGLGFRSWALDQDDRFPMAVSNAQLGTLEFVNDGRLMYHHFQALSNELNIPKTLVCPADNRQPAFRFADLKNQNISYFIGLDAQDAYPGMFLTGDRNITNGLTPRLSILELRPDHPAGWTREMHDGVGNIGLADGSVQTFTTTRLHGATRYTGNTTNRIALP